MLRCLKTLWSISSISARLTDRSSIKLTTIRKYRSRRSGGGWKESWLWGGKPAAEDCGFKSQLCDWPEQLGWSGLWLRS